MAATSIPMFGFANPARFMQLSSWLAPLMGWLAVAMIGIGLYLSLFASPPDYQQSETVRIMYVHVPAAWLSMFAYAVLAGASFVSLIWRHTLADIAAVVTAPIGAAFTALALITGMLWGKPMWGTWWANDPRLVSVLVLLFLYLGYMALRAGMDNPQRAERMGAILALVGVINLPIIKFSVDWWNTLHQPASVLRFDGPTIHGSMLQPLIFMGIGYMVLFAWLVLVRMRSEILRRQAAGRTRRAARKAELIPVEA